MDDDAQITVQRCSFTGNKAAFGAGMGLYGMGEGEHGCSEFTVLHEAVYRAVSLQAGP